jgi:beta-phosphoglucomutase
MTLSAIIFDFDGVIADTERLHLRAFQDVLAEEGVELTPAEYTAHYLGRADTEVFRIVARDRGFALDAARLQSLLTRKAARYERFVAAGEVLIPGVAERVRAWSAALPLAVASGARRVEVESVLRTADLLDCFGAIVAAEDVWHGKPAPDSYVLALDRLGASGPRSASSAPVGGLQPGNVVAIEDSLSGLLSIKAAGMHAVAVTTNYPAEQLVDAELVVSSVADLDLVMLERLVSATRLGR